MMVLFSAMIFVSCDTEPVDPVLSDNENPDNQNPGTNPGPDPGTTEGDYWPMAINNEWLFSDNGQMIEPMKITATENVEGNSYFKINQFFVDAGSSEFTGSATMLIRKNGGNYSVRISAHIPDQMGMSITVSPFEYIFLKDNLAAGESWEQTVTQTTSFEMPQSPIPLPPVVMTINITGEVLEKNVTAEVNGETYENVIKLRLTQVATAENFPETTTVSELWFAKDIGPIKSTVPGMTDQVLESYTLN